MRRATAVRFVGIGREKRSWTATASGIPADDWDTLDNGDKVPSLEWVAAEARRSGGLASRDVEADELDGDGCELGIYAGLHRVGSATIVFDDAT